MHLMAWEFGIRWQYLISYYYVTMYIVQLYKEEWAILRMLGCRAVALPSTERIVGLFYLFRAYKRSNGSDEEVWLQWFPGRSAGDCDENTLWYVYICRSWTLLK